MRQKDVDQLASIWATEVRDADTCELPGLEVAIGSVLRSVGYAQAFGANLDMTRLEALITECRRKATMPEPLTHLGVGITVEEAHRRAREGAELLARTGTATPPSRAEGGQHLVWVRQDDLDRAREEGADTVQAVMWTNEPLTPEQVDALTLCKADDCTDPHPHRASHW